MPAGQHGATAAAYRPTSLDFINLPNPIEPYAGSQRHPLNGPSHLGKSRVKGNNSNQGHFQLILDANASTSGPAAAAVERSDKRQKVSDNTLLDLPKLPVRTTAKRMRIPPTLSGLHQPPPDAGLLPSINVEKPRQSHSSRALRSGSSTRHLSERQRGSPPTTDSHDGLTGDGKALEAASNEPPKSSSKRSRRNKWTTAETQDLLKGVARFGIGHWTKILHCPDFHFHRRTALDLKDRFRVCCPDDYKPHASAAPPSQNSPDGRPPAGSGKSHDGPDALTRGPAPERVSTSELKDLGIEQPFAKSSRRSRHGYSTAEDEALLRGFAKYGNSWASIRADPALGLAARKATDLRDRFRTKYRAEYAKAGLTVKQDKLAAKSSEVLVDAEAVVDVENEVTLSTLSTLSRERLDSPGPLSVLSAPPPQDSSVVELTPGSRATSGRRPAAQALFSLDDIFLGANFGSGEDAEEGEPIVLDRGILDWAANDGGRPTAAEHARNGGIDPLMTLNLPKPTSSTLAISSTQPAQTSMASTTSLPSLSTMVAPGNSAGIEQSEPLGLPSLVHWFGAAENDGRAGMVGHGFPTLEELLS